SYTKNLPSQTSVAGPRRKTSPCCKRTICGPPGACTLTGDCARPLSIAAPAAALEPVPEECVSPTPRSKKRTSIADFASTCTSSAFTPCLKIGLRCIPADFACQSSQNSSRKTTKCGLPIETGIPFTSPHNVAIAISAPTHGAPIAASNSDVFPLRAINVHFFSPAPVRMVTDSFWDSAQRYAATQRVPLPEISASGPSALIRRASTSASPAAYSHSTPSAPTPLWRSQI